MKAQIISDVVYDGAMGYIHGMAYEINRILVPDANNLAITEDDNNNFYVWDDFKIKDKCKVVREVDIPCELVQEAIAFMNDRNELYKQFEKILLEGDTENG